MKKTMSSKTVLSALLDEWNENSEARQFYRATECEAAAAYCDQAMITVCNILEALGFKEDEDYRTVQAEKTASGKTFTYYKKELIK